MSLIKTLRFITSHPLSRKHKVRSIIRFVKWQIGKRLIPYPVVYEWVNGSKFFVMRGETGLTGNIYAGLHEFADMGFLLHFLRDDDLFVDVGANVGSYTILACSAIGAHGIAFEPVPSAYQRLVENIRLNHLEEKAKCINKAVGDREGNVTFTCDADTTNHALAPGEHSDSTISVPMTTLDAALCDELPVLLKIDVEGYETLVLEGALSTLQKESLCAVIMELNGSGSRYGFDESRLLVLMAKYGFETFSYNPLERILTNLGGKSMNCGNTLFIRNKSYVEERIRSAPLIKIHDYQF